MELVPLNSFFIDGDFVFFDQEYRREEYPLNAIKARVITTLYFGNGKLDHYIPRNELYKRYGLLDELPKWREMERQFLVEIRNDDKLQDYHRKVRRRAEIVQANRQRVNDPIPEQVRRTYIFDGDANKDCYVFGSGIK